MKHVVVIAVTGESGGNLIRPVISTFDFDPEQEKVLLEDFCAKMKKECRKEFQVRHGISNVLVSEYVHDLK